MRKVLLTIFLFLLININTANSDNHKIEDYSLSDLAKVGDSLLNLVDEQMILEQKKISFLKGLEYYDVLFELDTNQYAQFYLKEGDKSYKIKALGIFVNMKIDECIDLKTEIRKEWDVQFANQEFKSGSSPIVFDKSGKSMEHIDQYIFKDGAIAKIGCREFSSEMKQLDNDQDDFSIFYESANFTKWHKLHLIKLLSEG
tara:strand:- start:125 stop:724 length:600 start_codon:yes stop_codon:yes gene_type:complete